MAVRSSAEQLATDAVCRRCNQATPAIKVRNDLLCRDCFLKYAQSKVIKRMESFRPLYASRDKTHTLLLPLSLGPGSTTLLHILSHYLRGQVQRTGRAAYTLHVLHVQQTPGEVPLLDTIKASYPEHSYSVISLSDAMADPSIKDLFPSAQTDITDAEARLTQVLSACTSTTARLDLLQVLQTRVVVSFAKTHECECVIWGHSTTRLAEQTLAETAKGRGFALHLTAADGATHHRIPLYYPCRDLLSSEVTSYGSLSDPPILYAVHEVTHAVSSKQATIDSLMQQYFASAEKEYPSIVANVVRTAAKLEGDPLSLVEQQCELCEMPLEGNAPPRSRICHPCIRIMPV